MKKCSAVLVLVTQLCPSLCDPMDCSMLGSFVHGDSSGKNTGVGCHSLLHGIFPIQGLGVSYLDFQGFPGGSAGKESTCNVRSLGWEDPLEKEQLRTPVF